MKFLLLVLWSFGLGALHALEPGHGKTVVGAYLVGSKGRISDAVLLGLVVTLTHSGSVVLLGIFSTVAAAYFVPETVRKVLEVVSGLLVVGVGGWMIFVRLRQARGHDHGHNHGHDHDHDHTHPHDHSHDHAHDHDHPHEHAHSHEESHTHSHGGHSHSHVPVMAPGERPSLSQLIALGVSGGIVPCPAALAVLLGAVSFGQFVRGLSLVIAFSIGMAAVLVAIGIVMVKAASFTGKYVAESKWTRVVPVISAIVITLVGVGLTVRAIMDIV